MKNNLSIKQRKRIIENFYNNLDDICIVEYTTQQLKLDKNTPYWQSRIQFLKDFRDYVLKNWRDEKIQYIYPSIAYNI